MKNKPLGPSLTTPQSHEVNGRGEGAAERWEKWQNCWSTFPSPKAATAACRWFSLLCLSNSGGYQSEEHALTSNISLKHAAFPICQSTSSTAVLSPHCTAGSRAAMRPTCITISLPPVPLRNMRAGNALQAIQQTEEPIQMREGTF